MTLPPPTTALLLLLLLLPRFTSPSPLPAAASDLTYNSSCTAPSLSSWAWSLSDLYFHSSVVFSTPAHQIDGGWVSFSLASPVVDVAFDCQASSTQLQDWFYGDQWYACTNTTGGGAAGEVEAEARFRYERVTGRVDVAQSWVCRDDPVYPVYFNASGSGTVSLSCNETRWQSTNWTLGQIYSTDTVECAKANLTIRPSEISAVS